MPYKRKQTTGYYARRQPAAKRRVQVSRMAYQPRAFQQGEWKYVDTVVSQAADSTGAMTLLNGLVPGTGASQRIGMKVALRSIEFKGQVRVTAATGADQIQRYIVLLDRQANGAAPAALTDFLNGAGVYYSLRNLANRRRFKAIHDRMFSLNATGEPDSQRCWKFYIKFRKPITVEFNAGNAGTVADIVTNSLYFISLGQAPAGATAGSILGYCRLRYTDL